jgi:pteridine reductase
MTTPLLGTGKPVALVTGGARRVGKAIVEKLAAGGFDVAFTYHGSKDDAMALAEALRARGTKVQPIFVDLADPLTAADTVDGLFRGAFSRLDVLVNNASIYEPTPFQDVLPNQIRVMNAIHIETPLLLVQAVTPMLRQRKGCVINMVDLLAERPWPKYLAYCASKAGLWNLTLGLARELAPDIRVNGIAPGVVEWPADYPEEERDKYLRRVPLGRAGTPQDVAELVHFLATSGKYITGQIIRLDGGRAIT